MSGEQIDVTPEPTPEEKEAIRRALEALGLVEPGAVDGGVPPAPTSNDEQGRDG